MAVTTPGQPGSIVGFADLSKLVFGGAGGEGGADEDGALSRNWRQWWWNNFYFCGINSKFRKLFHLKGIDGR